MLIGIERGPGAVEKLEVVVGRQELAESTCIFERLSYFHFIRGGGYGL